MVDGKEGREGGEGVVPNQRAKKKLAYGAKAS
jgi:hypothetical protein